MSNFRTFIIISFILSTFVMLHLHLNLGIVEEYED